MILLIYSSQLQSLVNDATELQEAYPGDNAEHIATQQEAIVTNWNLLQAKSLDRKNALQAAHDYHKLLAAVSTQPKLYVMLVGLLGVCSYVQGGVIIVHAPFLIIKSGTCVLFLHFKHEIIVSLLW